MIMDNIKAIIVANNEVSLINAEYAISYFNIDKKDAVLFLIRPSKSKRVMGYFDVICTGKAYNNHRLSDILFSLNKYVNTINKLKYYLRNSEITNVFIVNNDHLLTNHILHIHNKYYYRISVIAEGLMNYQNITKKNRSAIGFFFKKILAFIFNIKYVIPKTHLSGAFENSVEDVFTFSKTGINAPIDKVRIVKNFSNTLNTSSNKCGVLLLLSGLYTMLPSYEYSNLMILITNYIKNLNPRIIYIKKHPRYQFDPILDIFNDYIEVDQDIPIEEIINELEISHIVGSFSTALITLKMIQPELISVDIGYSIYSKYLDGFDTIFDLYKSTNIELFK